MRRLSYNNPYDIYVNNACFSVVNINAILCYYTMHVFIYYA